MNFFFDLSVRKTVDFLMENFWILAGGPEAGAVPDLDHLVQSGTGDFRKKKVETYNMGNMVFLMGKTEKM